MPDAAAEMPSRAVVLARWQHLMGEGAAPGSWLAGGLVPGEGEEIRLVDPATGAAILSYRDAGDRLAAEAVRAAAAGFRAWSQLIPNPIDQNRCAQSRSPMDMMRPG